jgi:hypothetical protein
MANALRLLLALALAAGLTSCGGDDSSSRSRLDPEVAARLASASEEVAAAFEQHRCAEPALRVLERRANDTAVPVAVRSQVRRVVDRADVTCPKVAPPPLTPTPTLSQGDDEDDHGDEGHGQKHGKHKKEKQHGRGNGRGGND